MDEVRRAPVVETLRPDEPLPSVRELAAELRLDPKVMGWRELPSLVRWAGAVLLWSAVGLAGLIAATWRPWGGMRTGRCASSTDTLHSSPEPTKGNL